MVAIEWSRRSGADAPTVARTRSRPTAALGAARHLTANWGGASVSRDPFWPAVYGNLSGEPTPDLEAPSRED